MNSLLSRPRRRTSVGAALVLGVAWFGGLAPESVCAALDPATLVAADVGSPGMPGNTSTEADRVRITGGGKGIGFSADQFHFAAAVEPGDFDVQLRVAALKATDLWAKAGLMVRDGLDANARFAAVFTTPSGAGCLFQSRDAAAGAAASQGTFPANQPITWLRLRREGDLVTGYAGYDGKRWTQLGTRTLALGTNGYLGLAVTSHNTNAVTTAEFRDLRTTAEASVVEIPTNLEPPGPSSRRTSLVISEIMYHPAPRVDGMNLEFVELYNSQPYYEEIGGWRLTGEIEYTFPPGTVIPGCGYLVVAAVPADVAAAYGLDGVLGPYSGQLENKGGPLRLLGDRSAVLLDFTYNDREPWPELADGTGHSLVLARASYGETDPRAWAASRIKGGSPGMPEAFELTPASGVCINEWQMPDEPGNGFVELFNASGDPADLSGLRLGRTPSSLTFAVPTGTTLAPGGLVRFTWAELGFRPDPLEDTLLLESADGSRFLDQVRCEPQWPGTATGRWPNGDPTTRPLASPTPGTSNARPLTGVVINEVNASPLSGDNAEEFVELHNATAQDVDLTGWRLRSGVDFTFPAGTTLPAGGYVVVAKDATRLRTLHPELAATQIVGDFQGNLAGRGETLRLARPVTVKDAAGLNETTFATVHVATYVAGGRWNPWSSGGGSTAELVDPRADATLAAGWTDSDETARSQWTTVEATGVLDNGPTGGGFPGGGGTVNADSLHIILLGEGECLIDNVEVIGTGGTNRVSNGTFETGSTGWTFSGNHVRTSLETTEGNQSSQSLHLRASGNGDTGANKIFVKLTSALATGSTATLRARVRWLRGWPEILLRLHGNFVEAYGRLSVPPTSGTPGTANSRAQANAGPTFGTVTHFPVVPGTNDPVRVTARVDDPDGVTSVTLRYRIDPATTNTAVVMVDDGTGGDRVPGDGIYTGIIPAPGLAKLVAFTVEAQDGATAPATSMFPPQAPARECLVRFGEGSQSGAFGTYRLWVTQANSDTWRTRPVLSNEPADSTFVYGNSRPIYNSGGRFAGSPFHQQFTTGPASDAHFVVQFPDDDRVLGAGSLNKLHAPGNGAFDDTLLQREQVVYWLARQSGLPWLHRRFFHFYVNGAKKKTLMEDTQVGNDDLVDEFWPEDTGGDLFKMQPWFEFPDATSQSLQMQGATFVAFNRYTSGGALKLARYRWNWLVRGADGTANNYSNVFQLIQTTTDYTNATYAANVESLVDVDQWLRSFAINHAVGNWDSVGYQNQQNTYSYKPRNGRWELVIWDANISFGNSRSDGPSNLPLFTTGDPTLSRWLTAGSAFRRRYLVALEQLVNGPMQASAVTPMLDAKYAAFQEHGVTAGAPGTIASWITSARTYILSQLNRESPAFAVTSVSGSSPFILSGNGPLQMAWLDVNGSLVPVTWDTTSAWRATFTPTEPSTHLVVQALDAQGELLAGTGTDIDLGVEHRLTLSQSNSTLFFEYPVLQSGRYVLQWTPTLDPPIWQTVTNPAASLGTLRFQIPTPASAAFYRILEP